ncbi:hypothetical protein BpHYR1_046273 [Brachionus plicatilis]|uniref:Uncharacterized protein n=1 Tax=Brachionus plicatilis TaxID=10195 RepID=A0A3M7PXX1_BRAPC|nr:hypothetical protein BpHYR1_046273 [Brachionus plicatilis]
MFIIGLIFSYIRDLVFILAQSIVLTCRMHYIKWSSRVGCSEQEICWCNTSRCIWCAPIASKPQVDQRSYDFCYLGVTFSSNLKFTNQKRFKLKRYKKCENRDTICDKSEQHAFFAVPETFLYLESYKFIYRIDNKTRCYLIKSLFKLHAKTNIFKSRILDLQYTLIE